MQDTGFSTQNYSKYALTDITVYYFYYNTKTTVLIMDSGSVSVLFQQINIERNVF